MLEGSTGFGESLGLRVGACGDVGRESKMFEQEERWTNFKKRLCFYPGP